MKRIIGLSIVLIGICNWCFANVLEKGIRVLDYDSNRNCFTYSYTRSLQHNGPEGNFSKVTFCYLKEYDFGKAYNDDSNLCKPQESIVFMVEGKDNINLNNFSIISEHDGNSIWCLPVTFKKINLGNSECIYIDEIDITEQNFLRQLIGNEKELGVDLMYGEAKLYIIDLTISDVRDMNMIMQYDLFKDYSQKENIERAIASAKKYRNTKSK